MGRKPIRRIVGFPERLVSELMASWFQIQGLQEHAEAAAGSGCNRWTAASFSNLLPIK
jgi:hypothetical protein